jgi:hypothetical protein
MNSMRVVKLLYVFESACIVNRSSKSRVSMYSPANRMAGTAELIFLRTGWTASA